MKVGPGSMVASLMTLRWWRGWRIWQSDGMHRFPVVGGDHLDRVPRTAIEKRPVWSFAGALLTTNAEVRIDFDSSERRVVLIRHPEHARLDRAILDACG